MAEEWVETEASILHIANFKIEHDSVLQNFANTLAAFSLGRSKTALTSFVASDILLERI
jgi:hypothetical protein